MHTVFLALGSNLGERLVNLEAAIQALPPRVTSILPSRVYETQPWGVTDQPHFLNIVVRGETNLTPPALLKFIKGLEIDLGRLPAIRWGPRLIDIDILFYDDRVINSGNLEIPHPRLHERAFVLVPLADLAPGRLHPLLGKTVEQLLAGLDTNGVKEYAISD